MFIEKKDEDIQLWEKDAGCAKCDILEVCASRSELGE